MPSRSNSPLFRFACVPPAIPRLGRLASVSAETLGSPIRQLSALPPRAGNTQREQPGRGQTAAMKSSVVLASVDPDLPRLFAASRRAVTGFRDCRWPCAPESSVSNFPPLLSSPCTELPHLLRLA